VEISAVAVGRQSTVDVDATCWGETASGWSAVAMD